MSEQHLEDGTRASSGHVDAGDAGYSKGLKHRHVNMIAVGGAVGTGLFLGARGRLADAGPFLFIAYAVCGVFAFLVVRALGELVLYRPSSGAFVSYAREFLGEKGAYTAGWMYFLVTLAFLASVLVLMYADGGAGRTTVLCLPLIVAALVAGWYGIRGRTARTSTGADA
ncbi:amino acid permease [Streptomyces sp. NPDC006314]|uniref:amino acid permease n=1 Tax=Streptomyces sp. NPDC006314 TaxID=3154475 RepID=UPI0033AFCDEF